MKHLVNTNNTVCEILFISNVTPTGAVTCKNEILLKHKRMWVVGSNIERYNYNTLKMKICLSYRVIINFLH